MSHTYARVGGAKPRRKVTLPRLATARDRSEEHLEDHGNLRLQKHAIPDIRPGIALIFVPYVHTLGGVERLILTLSEYLYREAQPHVLVCFNDTVGLSSHAQWPLEVQQLRPSRHWLSESWCFSRFLRKMELRLRGKVLAFDLKSAHYCSFFPIPDFILHVDDPPSLLPRDITKFAPSARRRWPPFKTAPSHGALQQCRAELVYRMIRQGAKRAHTVVVTTDASAQEVQGLFDVKSQIVRLGVRSSRVRGPRPQLRNGSFSFLSVGRLESNKRVDWILRALAILEAAPSSLSSNINWRLDLVGEGGERLKLAALVKELGLEHRTFFHGFVSEQKLEMLYQEAGVVLMPAIQGYGIPALEALVRGVPVVLHKQSGASEVLGHNPWAMIVEDGITELASGISRMVSCIRSGELFRSPPPQIRSDEEWAASISRLCGWC